MRKLKLFFTALLLFFCFAASAQDRTFYRAHTISFSAINSDGEIIPGEESPCDLLVEINDNKVVVYSEKEQIYRIINQRSQDDKSATWFAVDSQGVSLTIGLAGLFDTGEIIIFIVYSDFSWYYVCKQN